MLNFSPFNLWNKMPASGVSATASSYSPSASIAGVGGRTLPSPSMRESQGNSRVLSLLKNPKVQTVGKVILVGVPICLVGGVLSTLGLEYVKILDQRRRILNLISKLEDKISSNFSAEVDEDSKQEFKQVFEDVKRQLRDNINIKMTFRVDRWEQENIKNIENILFHIKEFLIDLCYDVNDPPRTPISCPDSSRDQPFSRKLQNVAEVLEAFCKAKKSE